MRSKQAKAKPPVEVTNKIADIPQATGGIETRSHRSSRSVNASNGFVKASDPAKSKYLVYEDPAASLNVSEDKWNAIV